MALRQRTPAVQLLTVVLLALTAVSPIKAQFGANGTFHPGGVTRNFSVTGPWNFIDTLSLNYTTQALPQSFARAQCQTGQPAYPVVEATIDGVQQAMLAENLTCSQLIAAYVQRISYYDQSTGVNAVRLVMPDLANVTAAKDAQLAAVIASGNNTLPDLFCVPFVVKDNYDTVGVATANGAVALLDNFPSADATIVAQIKAAGAVILAKGNMAEWAFSNAVSIGSAFGIVRNPYDTDRVTAGSSGGPAAAVSASFAMIGLGTDTGNSIRGPSGHNALVGIRSTIGITSRAGIIPLILNRDIGGPMGRTVTDVAKVFQHIVGPDPTGRDDVTLRSANSTLNPYGIPSNYTQFLNASGLQGKTIGVLRSLEFNPTTSPDGEIQNLFNRAIMDLQSLGATVIDNFTVTGNSLGDKPWDGRNSWYVGTGANGSFVGFSNPQCANWIEDLQTYLSTAGSSFKTVNDIYVSGGFHPSVVGSFTSNMRNQNISSASLPTANGIAAGQVCTCGDDLTNPCRVEFRTRLLAAMDAQNADALIYPGWANPARLVGDYDSPLGDLSQIIPPNTGMPGIVVPMGYTSRGLPATLQIVARPYAEPTLFTIAYAYEQGTKRRTPPPGFSECTANSTSSGITSKEAFP
ncbi:Amidase family protein [Klebsormidium nitens]|uniref:Amidase family protein n=1 Tax=Klebsormidium nitens TaxID=105231 RepID=A0A1Y1I2F5_KLENI|nr:Amidase family protein [Klebsormidium nitens]|eukprot:GAQ83619.1 Amidase family protein [Klebsormidium nitens]